MAVDDEVQTIISKEVKDTRCPSWPNYFSEVDSHFERILPDLLLSEREVQEKEDRKNVCLKKLFIFWNLATLTSVHHESIICPSCVHHVSIMCPSCAHRVSIMCPSCVHRVSIMCPSGPFSNVAINMLSLPATPATCERIFRTYSGIRTVLRVRLTADRAGKLSFLLHKM